MRKLALAGLAAGLAILAVGMVYLLKRPAARPQVERASPTGTTTRVLGIKVGDGANELIRNCAKWFNRGFSAERHLMDAIRESLANEKRIGHIPNLSIVFDPSCSWVAVTLFQEGVRPIRRISKRETLPATLDRITQTLRQHERFSEFKIRDPDKCRILLEVVVSERSVDIHKVVSNKLRPERFEPGITGFRLDYGGKIYFYMPSDAMVKSHLSFKSALSSISKKAGVAKTTNKISERVRLVKELPAKWSIINSIAFVSYGQDVLPLYRGYPMPVEFSEERIFEMAESSAEWVFRNMTEDGKFLYYYDAARDSTIDHVHPDRSEENSYYNMLRHSGGIIALLQMYELTKDEKYVGAADKALGFVIGHLRKHVHDGRKAYYVYFNNKAKLGGSGIALAAFMRYYEVTGDTKYNRYIFGLAEHLLSRVTEDGEMIGYYIHPAFNGGDPITCPRPEEKRQLFSFYYPGEALLGLALFEREMDLTAEYRKHVRETAKRALDFLVDIRPVKYADLFKPLPSDGWLMQAVEEWSYHEEFQKEKYLDFVFNDARQMIAHMYDEKNSPYYDYPGTFYYNYGDHAYPDGARAEGLIAAYFLARRMNESEPAESILRNCKTVARSLMHTYNSPESTYMHKVPHKSIGSFRFKLTRQWVRVDTVQHTSCFFVRLLQAVRLEQDGVANRNAADKNVLSAAAN